MSDETKGAVEPTESPIDESAAERDFAQAGGTADQQVAARSDEGGSRQPAPAPAPEPEKPAEGNVPHAKGMENEDAEPEKAAKDGEKAVKDVGSDSAKAKTEAEELADAQREAEERALVAAEAEKTRKAQEEASRTAASAPLDATNIAGVIRDRIKGAKIEGYENFEAFEKEYGKPLTEAVSAIAYEIARSMVAPMAQEQAIAKQEAVHQEFVSKIVEAGHPDVVQIEKSPDFWSWIDQKGNEKMKYLVEKADIKGTDMVLRAYKAEKGIAMGKATAREPTERERLVSAQKEAQDRADKVNKVTGRRQASIPKTGADADDIEDDESAQALFDETVKEQNKRNNPGSR